MLQEVLFAGFGGQGVVLGATVTAHIAARCGNHVTIIPSYGNEQRGGSAYCDCKFVAPPDEIFDPRFEHPTVLIAMNDTSYHKYISAVAKDALILLNADSTDLTDPHVEGCTVVPVHCATLADRAGSVKCANFVMMGAMCKLKGFFTPEEATEGIRHYMETNGKAKLAEMNVRAFMAGYDSV